MYLSASSAIRSYDKPWENPEERSPHDDTRGYRTMGQLFPANPIGATPNNFRTIGRAGRSALFRAALSSGNRYGEEFVGQEYWREPQPGPGQLLLCLDSWHCNEVLHKDDAEEEPD